MHKKKIILRLLFMVLGLYLCFLGLTFFYFNGLGLDPWNVLREGFGVGTVIIAIFTGIIIQNVFDLLKFNP